MKMARRLRLLYALALLLAAAAYSAVLFSLKRTMMAAHWVAYGFTLLAFLWLFVETCIPEGKYKRYPMFGMAVSKLSGVYFAVQFALGGVLVMFLPSPPVPAVLIPESVLLLIAAVAVLVVLLGKNAVAAQDDRVGDKVRYLQGLLVSLERLEGAVPEAVRPQLEALLEDVRYSEPMGHEALDLLEEGIRMKVYALCDAVDDKRMEGLEGQIKALRALVRERNSRCRMLKS